MTQAYERIRPLLFFRKFGVIMFRACLRPVLTLLVVTSCLQALSQSEAFEKMIFDIDSLNIRYPREKIFIHHDKPYYRVRDTIWMKGYILTTPEHIPNDSSRLVYIEVINAQNEVVKRVSSPCVYGLFVSNIILSERDYTQGEYLLRAYTKYLRNFGDSLFFESRFKVIDMNSEEWQTSIRRLSFTDNRLLLSANLADQYRQKLTNRALSIRLKSGRKVVFRGRIMTDQSGDIYVDTLLKNGDYKELQLEIADRTTLKLQVPVYASDKQLIDLQFLPEGGSFVAGKHQRLGFKAINAWGKGIDVKGVIKDSKGTIITSFASVHKGMGIVSLTPEAGERYTAVLENGLTYQLPVAANSGIILQIIDRPAEDSIKMRIEGTADMYGKRVYFTATSGGIHALRGRAPITAKGYEFHLNRKQLIPGITTFTLYDENLQPINERSIFVWDNTDLKLSLTSNKDEYLKKDSISLKLKALNANGEATRGSFSMAVLDTGQVKVSDDAENILSYMILSSDIKGQIEEPYYYFKNPDPAAVEALLLTQGWVSYNRKFSPLPFAYETRFSISGKVENLFGKPVAKSHINLFAKVGKNSAFVTDTVTDPKGRFVFDRFSFYETDSLSMVLMALNKRGKAFNVGIELDEPRYPTPTASTMQYGASDILVDTVAREYINRQEKINDELRKSGVVLQEVVVEAKRKIPNSKNLNEDGGADQTLDEDMLIKMAKESLLTILEKQVPGFRLGSPPRSRALTYMINSNIVRLIIDGVDLHFFYNPVTGQNDEPAVFLRSYLEAFSGEDLLGIEIMNKPRYNSSYRSKYLSVEEFMNSGPVQQDFSFIEITTRTGEGPFMKKTPGSYLLRPLYPFISKQFYSPRYTSPDQETIVPDLRQTIYWNPEVITNAEGEAIVSFYTSESNSNYMVIIQGTDLNGGLGVGHWPVRVKSGK